MHSTTGAELQQFQALEAEVQMCMETVPASVC